MPTLRLARYRTEVAWRVKLFRVFWQIAYRLLYRPSPVWFFQWRRFLLRAFGANIAASAFPYPKMVIWAPWNLVMEAESCIADHVECYSVGLIHLRAWSCISQNASLCTATHDYASRTFDLIVKPIVIEEAAWVAARAFIGPGVTVGTGAVVGACAVVMKDVDPWTVVGGNPARKIKARVIRDETPYQRTDTDA